MRRGIGIVIDKAVIVEYSALNFYCQILVLNFFSYYLPENNSVYGHPTTESTRIICFGRRTMSIIRGPVQFQRNLFKFFYFSGICYFYVISHFEKDVFGNRIQRTKYANWILFLSCLHLTIFHYQERIIFLNLFLSVIFQQNIYYYNFTYALWVLDHVTCDFE